MSKSTVIYTREGLEELEEKLDYMVNGQGFTVILVDTKHTRRRTLGNMLKKCGVENIIEADNYARAVTALKGREEKKNVIISDLEIGKINGLKLITDFLRSAPRSRGIIVVDTVPVKLQQIVDVSKMLAVLKRPFDGDNVADIIRELGLPI